MTVLVFRTGYSPLEPYTTPPDATDEHGGTPDAPAEVIELLTAPGPFAVLVEAGGDPAWYTDPVSKLSSVVMPLVSGEPNWYLSSAPYEDYFSAAVWAMVLLERWAEAIATKIAPAAALPEHLKAFITPGS